MKIEKRKISELIRAEYNPRKISVVQLQELKDGIEEFGLVSPLVVNENPERKNVIVGGHQRLKLWEELGNKEVDCSIVNLPLDKERKLNIKLNKNGGTFDDDLLKEFFDYEELIDWGFTAGELFDQDEKTEGLIDDDEIPEVKESIVVRGDIWKLGEHRVMCGDSTSSDDVEKLMNGEKADMVFTDPPYGMDLDAEFQKIHKGATTGKNHRAVIGDDKYYNPQHIFDFFNDVKEIFIWGADYFIKSIPNSENGSWIIWDKTVGKFEGRIGNEFEMCFSKKRHKKFIERIEWVGYNGMQNEDTKKRVHPTQKPIKLTENIIEKYSKKNNLIIDIFLGSGSTLIAAEKLNRKCYGMELDEKYCDVIIERWEQFTGNKAEKING